MKVKNGNVIREKFTSLLMEYLEGIGEDVGQIASNSFNFPVVAEDGEEGFVRVVVSVPKSNDGYEEREDYEITMRNREEEKKRKAEAKAKKIKRDKERREAEKKAKEEKREKEGVKKEEQ